MRVIVYICVMRKTTCKFATVWIYVMRVTIYKCVMRVTVSRFTTDILIHLCQ